MGDVDRPRLHWAAIGCTILAVVLTLIHLGAEVVRGRLDPGQAQGVLAFAHQAGMLLAAPTFALLGLLIVWKASEQPGAAYAGIFLGAYGVWGIGIGGWIGDGPERVAFLTVVDIVSHTAAVRFTQLFPRPLESSDIRALGRRRAGRPLAKGIAALLNPRLFWPVMVGIGLTARFVPVPFLYVGHVIGVSALAVTYLYAGHRTGDDEARRRIFWLLEAALVFLATELLLLLVRLLSLLNILRLDVRAWHDVVHPLQTWTALACFALAIFFHGAFDSRLVVRRTTVASLGGALVVVLFITLETAVSEALEALFGFESQVGTIVAGVTVALLFRPIVQKIEGRFAGAASQDVVEPEGG